MHPKHKMCTPELSHQESLSNKAGEVTMGQPLPPQPIRCTDPHRPTPIKLTLLQLPNWISLEFLLKRARLKEPREGNVPANDGIAAARGSDVWGRRGMDAPMAVGRPLKSKMNGDERETSEDLWPQF